MAFVIEGMCSDEEFIDTDYGILCFIKEEGHKRPFKDGTKVKITITPLEEELVEVENCKNEENVECND